MANALLSLSAPVSELSGVGEKIQQQLKRLDIDTINDLIHHIPQRYVDYSRIEKTSQLRPGPVTLRGEFRAITQRRTRKGMVMTSAVLDDGHGGCEVVWFNQPFRKADLAKQGEVLLSGDLAFSRDRLSIVNPEYEPADQFHAHTGRIVPIYPLTKGITSKKLRTLTLRALAMVETVEDYLPPSLVKQYQLLPYQAMLASLHYPKTMEQLEQAKQRWAFNELFDVMLAHQLTRKQLDALKAPKLPINEQGLKEFTANLSFKLTDDQRIASWEIVQDISSERPMNRLLQGDVGSGKTVVGALAIQQALDAGKQVAVVAPTEIVAQQHFKTYAEFFKGEVVLLTSSVTTAAKRRRKNMLSSGEKKLAIGTHALLQRDVEFGDLALLIIDEQHRFGVKQRQHLTKQKSVVPHVLSMTATPIPRTLALTLYSDMQVSTIRHLPPGRKPVKTEVYGPSKRQSVYDHIDQELDANRQAYVVCPLIDDSDTLGVTSVNRELDRIRGYFKKRRVAALHGQLKPEEKNEIIVQFNAGDIDILVATTVVEVGVNVPEATVMLIEGAERFGLAQLHQLRGRVGRAQHQAYCYALTSNASHARKDRLQAFAETTDGFALAELDLKLRGPGAMYSTLQHGMLDFVHANIADTTQIKNVKSAVNTVISEAGLLQYTGLKKRMQQYRAYYHLN